MTYPGTKISTLEELFAFARCADPGRLIHWNIESKINAVQPNSTRGVNDFVTLQHEAFLKSGYRLSQITVSNDTSLSTFCKRSDAKYSTRVLIGGHSSQ